MKRIIFVSGVHGVGKGTLCRSLQDKLGYPVYSCSDLIKQNSEYTETDKLVSGAEKNQIALLNGLRAIEEETILLDGHFCLVDKNQRVVELDYEIFDAIKPSRIINVICDEKVIFHRLAKRDGNSLKLSLLEKLQRSEVARVNEFASSRELPCLLFKSGECEDELVAWLQEGK